MEDGYYSSDVTNALGIANLRVGMKLIREEFWFKLAKMKDGKGAFVPITSVPKFVKYLEKERILTVKANGVKNGIVFSIPKEFRPKLDSKQILESKYGIKI